MKRLELYVSNNGQLVLNVFEFQKNVNYKHTFKGYEAYKYIRRLKHKKIINIIEDPKDVNATLVYKDCVVILNDCDELLNRRGLKIIIDGIKEYIEKEKLKRIKGKKVKRKNKYDGRRVAAAGLTVLIIGTCALGFSKQKSSKNVVHSLVTEEQVDDEDVYTTLDYDMEDDYDEPIVETVEETPEVSEVIEEVVGSIETTKEEKLDTVSVDYTDRSNTTKANTTQNYYGNIIDKYARMYGVDPALALAVATQERGIHSSVTDAGGATGLMQIQNAVWLGQAVSAYNFQTGQMENFVVTMNQLQNVESNIRIGCMILQNSFQYMKYNTLAAIQCYNMGHGNMMKILRQYAQDTNTTVDEVLNNMEDDGWLSYRKFITQGDQKYIEHVLSWMGDDVDIKNIKADGTLVSININNNFNSKKVY